MAPAAGEVLHLETNGINKTVPTWYLKTRRIEFNNRIEDCESMTGYMYVCTYLPSFSMVISKQFSVRVEENTVMAMAQSDPNWQTGCFQPRAWLFAHFSVALVHQESNLASHEDAPLCHSLEFYNDPG